MAQVILDALVARFGEAVATPKTQHGNETAHVDKAHLLTVARWLRDAPTSLMDMPIDATVVDYMGVKSPRFCVVWHLKSMPLKHRLRLAVAVEDNIPVPSLTPVWPGMNWHEREAWDLYGIRFDGHPDLRRILMYDPFVGHPLRRDYPIDKRQPLVPLRKVQSVPTQRRPSPEMLNRP